MRRLPGLFLIALVVLAACRFAPAPQPPTVAPAEREAQEYEVYAAAITADRGAVATSPIVDATTVYELPDALKQQPKLAALSPATLADYASANAAPQAVNPRLAAAGYRLIPSAFVDEIFSAGQTRDPWERLKSEYNARAIIRVSRAGLSPDMREAVVYVGYQCGPLCGTGTLYILARVNGTWTVRDSLGLWIS